MKDKSFTRNFVPAHAENSAESLQVVEGDGYCMTVLLRGMLILVSSGTTLYILRKIKQSKVQIEESVFWILFSASLIVISVFPGVAVWMSQLLGISSPVNFLFLFIIFVLLIKLFYMTLRISLLESKVKDLTQKIAIEENLNKNK